MTLKELIEKLQTMDPEMVLANGFVRPHSWRGSYAELAFEPADNVSVGEMLACARKAVRQTYTGYKGGEYYMDEDALVHLDLYGESSGFEESEAKMRALLDAGTT